MNVGQILETHLGWARACARLLLRDARCFDGATENEIKTAGSIKAGPRATGGKTQPARRHDGRPRSSRT